MVRRVVLVAAALCALAGGAAADDGSALLDRAQAAVDELDYEAARNLSEQALSAGGLEADELAQAYRIAGEVAAALGDSQAARRHFVRWVLLEPRAELRTGLSPKIVEPFTLARGEAERLGGMSLDIKVRRGRDRIRVVLNAKDPLKMVASMRVRLGDGAEVTVKGATAELPTSKAMRVDVAAVVLDENGNVLTRIGSEGAQGGDTEPVAITETPGERKQVHHSIPAPLRWPTWTGVAVAAAGFGGYFAYRVGKSEDELAALNADSSAHSFDEAIAIKERGERDALIANVGFGLAGAAAVAAVLTYVLDERRVEVLPAPGGSVGASAALRF